MDDGGLNMKLVYFAHPITHYNKVIEQRCLEIIEKEFDGEDFEIFNPNVTWLDRIYSKRKDDKHSNPFEIFTEIVAICDVVVGVSFMDGEIGAGVFKELQKAYDNDKETYIILGDMKMYPFSPGYEGLTVAETKERIKGDVI